MKPKKVFVSGCYDMLHSGHVAFFRQAAAYGDLYVGIGSDNTILQLKGRKTICSEKERLYMVKAIRYVKDARINGGSGMIDFLDSLEIFNPDIFVVNSDGATKEKEELCRQRGIEYIVLERIPDDNLVARSTTSIRNSVKSFLPYRLDLAGTWIDQPYVSKYGAGWAITVSLEPTEEFKERCGMSTSTRNAIKKLFPYQLPAYDPEKLAKLIFCFENEPNKKDFVSGAQDSIGICMPGLVRHFYDNNFWPQRIESVYDEDILCWLENHICLVLTEPRKENLIITENTDITSENVKKLTDAADNCWQAIMQKDLISFAKYYQASFEAQIKMFPNMVTDKVIQTIEKYKKDALAWKLSGAGGGGYIAFVCEKPLKDSIKIRIRRRELL